MACAHSLSSQLLTPLEAEGGESHELLFEASLRNSVMCGLGMSEQTIEETSIQIIKKQQQVIGNLLK